MKLLSKLFATTAALMLSSQLIAAPVTCGSTQRTATLDPALSCSTFSNLNGVGEIESALDGAFDPTWSQVADVNDSTLFGIDSYFGVQLTSGGWDGNSVTGNWTINAAFWSQYDDAIITMHVGNGGGDPDYFAWLIEDNAIQGTFSYDRLLNGGGGFSNMKLFARSEGTTTVTEPGTVALLAFGLLGLAYARRSAKV